MLRSGTRRRTTPAGDRDRDPDACREKALTLLERTRRTRSDLTKRLRDHGFEFTTIAQVLERLAEVGLVDDVEYARAYLSERWGRRPAGLRRLEQDLRRRGIAPADIIAARERIETERGETDEVASALRAIGQAERRYAKLDPRVRRQRLYAMLLRRGFDGDTIEAALRESERVATEERAPERTEEPTEV